VRSVPVNHADARQADEPAVAIVVVFEQRNLLLIDFYLSILIYRYAYAFFDFCQQSRCHFNANGISNLVASDAFVEASSAFAGKLSELARSGALIDPIDFHEFSLDHQSSFDGSFINPTRFSATRRTPDLRLISEL